VNHLPSTGTITHLATDVVTFPVRLAARTYGVARGTASVGRRLAHELTSPGARWETADTVVPAPRDEAPVTLGTEPGPVNVVEELDLDPAPVEKPREPATPAVTAIDQQAEPGLVQSTPADVAERIERAQDD
jgi:hypothetical protein